jgi:hypothetical protein
MHACNAGISWHRSYVRLRSYARLRSEDMTPVIYLDSSRTSRLRSTSRLRLYLLTLVAHHSSGRWACRLSYHLSCERHHMAELDDYNILQPWHLVKNRLGGTHDLISVQNLRPHSFTCRSNQAMRCMTKEHIACRNLRKIRVSRGTRYPTTPEDQCLQMSYQAST